MKPIETEEEYDAAMKELEQLLDELEAYDINCEMPSETFPAFVAEKGARLDELSAVVGIYEEEHYPILRSQSLFTTLKWWIEISQSMRKGTMLWIEGELIPRIKTLLRFDIP